ncbi:MAG: hypothetical protein Q9221_008002 [Calogaya cf. arnoldii]
MDRLDGGFQAQKRTIEKLAAEYNSTDTRVAREFEADEDYIKVLCNEDGFTTRDVEALCDVDQSTKSSTDAIGKKGIGFKSVFKVCDLVHIGSNGFQFTFDKTDRPFGMVKPTWRVFPTWLQDSHRTHIEGIDESSKRNRKIRDILPGAFLSAVHLFNESEDERLMWTRYLPGLWTLQDFFAPVDMVPLLEDSKVLFSHAGELMKPSSLMYVPPRFRFNEHRPVPLIFNGRHALSTRYDDCDITFFKRLRIAQLDLKTFVDALRHLANVGWPRIDWHEDLAKILVNINPESLADVPLIPVDALEGFQWVKPKTLKTNPVYFPFMLGDHSIPDGVAFRLVLAEAAANEFRQKLFGKLGVESLTVAAVCEGISGTLLMESRPITIGDIISRTKYLFRHRKAFSKRSIFFAAVVDGGDKSKSIDEHKNLRRGASTIYFDDPRERPYMISQLFRSKACYYRLHSAYLQHDPSIFMEDWMDWLIDHGISARPRPVTLGNSVESSGVEYLALHASDESLCKVILKHWEFYKPYLHIITDPLKRRLDRRILPTEALRSTAPELGVSLPWDRFLGVDLDDGDTTQYQLLSRFGLITQASRPFYLEILRYHAKRQDLADPKIQLLHQIYALLQKYENHAPLRAAFKKEKLIAIHVPGIIDGHNKWMGADECFWSKLSCLRYNSGISTHYSDCRKLFCDALVYEVDKVDCVQSVQKYPPKSERGGGLVGTPASTQNTLVTVRTSGDVVLQQDPDRFTIYLTRDESLRKRAKCYSIPERLVAELGLPPEAITVVTPVLELEPAMSSTILDTKFIARLPGAQFEFPPQINNAPPLCGTRSPEPEPRLSPPPNNVFGSRATPVNPLTTTQEVVSFLRALLPGSVGFDPSVNWTSILRGRARDCPTFEDLTPYEQAEISDITFCDKEGKLSEWLYFHGYKPAERWATRLMQKGVLEKRSRQYSVIPGKIGTEQTSTIESEEEAESDTEDGGEVEIACGEGPGERSASGDDDDNISGSEAVSDAEGAYESDDGIGNITTKSHNEDPKEWKHEDAGTVKTRADVMIAQSYNKFPIYIKRDETLRTNAMLYYIPEMLSEELGLPVEAKLALSAALQLEPSLSRPSILDEMRIARLPGAPAVSSLPEGTLTDLDLIEPSSFGTASSSSGNGGSSASATHTEAETAPAAHGHINLG